jgi:hypothetical protein
MERSCFTIVADLSINMLYNHELQGDSNMTGTDLCVNWTLIVPVIFEPPCIKELNIVDALILLIKDLLLYVESSD